MQPFTVQRKGALHDAGQADGSFASASLLRSLLDLEPLDAIARFVPPEAMEVYRSAESDGLFPFRPHSLDTAVLSAPIFRRVWKTVFTRRRGKRSRWTGCFRWSKPSATPFHVSGGWSGTPTSAFRAT